MRVMRVRNRVEATSASRSCRRVFETSLRCRAQRLVFEVLAEEMESFIHALAMRTVVPEDWEPSSGSQGG